MAKLPAFPKGLEEQLWPGGFTVYDEANAIVAYAFRNGLLEDLHAGAPSELLTTPGLSRITDDEMRVLMLEAAQKVASLLQLREADREAYLAALKGVNAAFCRGWYRGETSP